MLKKLVIIPGGFHPFHAGHKALYDAAVSQFPRADVYIAATDDQNARPFPFRLKQQLAQIAGIPKHRFIQVSNPFQAKEITQHYDPENTQLIFVRSDKDSGVAPLPGSVKKDGSAGYLQPLNRRNPEPMTKHGFMTYLPTVSFGPGMSSATEIRAKWPTMSDDSKADLVSSLYPAASDSVAKKAVEIFNTVLGEEKEMVSMPMGSVEEPKQEAKIIKTDDSVSILPSGGMGSYDEASLKSNLGNKLRTLADMLDSGDYDNLEYHIYQSGAMQAMVEALGQYKRFKDKKGNRPIKKDVEIDISNEDYLPEDELIVEYVFQSRPLRVLDNIAGRKDQTPFPIKFDDGSQVMVSPAMAKKFMSIYLSKDTAFQKMIDQKISQKSVFVDVFNNLVKGLRSSGVTVGDQS
jgi:hypothetical protein